MPENKDDIDLSRWDLGRAARENRVDIARTFLAMGDEYDIRYTHLPRSSVKILYSSGYGLSPLHTAADHGSNEVARLLIEHGAEIEARTKAGLTPLHRAATANAPEVARLLIEQGADVNATDRSGVTPLHLTGNEVGSVAVFPLYLEVARLLIEHGANTEGVDLSWMDD